MRSLNRLVVGVVGSDITSLGRFRGDDDGLCGLDVWSLLSGGSGKGNNSDDVEGDKDDDDIVLLFFFAPSSGISLRVNESDACVSAEKCCLLIPFLGRDIVT